MTDEQWSPWISHDGSECPIPWAEAGQYEARYWAGEVSPGRVSAKTLAGGVHDWWRHEGTPSNDIVAYRYLLSATPPGWTPPGSAYTAPRDDLAAMQPHPIEAPAPSVIDEVAAERRRQIEVEGWTAEHDDGHREGELAGAAACYALYRSSASPEVIMGLDFIETLWPWEPEWWKPKTPRRDLIRAAALLIAAVEQMDRQAAKEKPNDR